MAAEMMKNLDDDPLGSIKVKSAGTFAAEDMPATPEAAQVMEKRGMDLKRHRSQQFDADLANWADVILTMEAKHIEQIEAMVPAAEGKAHTLLAFGEHVDGFPGDIRYDIPDPFGEPYEVYEACANMLDAGIAKAVMRLAKENNAE
jgi:protein-tyrosine-phosphatase